MIKTRKKTLVIALFCVIVCFVFCLTFGAVGVINDNNISDGTYSNNNIQLLTVSVPYDNSDGLYTIQYFYIYGGNLNTDLFIINNQVNFYYDILPLYNEIGVSIDDDEIITYLENKYPSADFSAFEWLKLGYSTYLSDIFISIRSDLSYISSTSYNSGYNVGKSDGVLIGYSEGYNVGKSDGYSSGLDVGYNNGLEDSNALENGIKTIFSAPIYMLTGILDFEILGFSLYKFILSIITIFVIGFIVKSIFGLF